MNIKTAELTGSALNWAVAVAEGVPPEQLTFWGGTSAVVRKLPNGMAQRLDYDANANRMHPLIEQHGISTVRDKTSGEWYAAMNVSPDSMFGFGGDSFQSGPTALIAAARCYVAHKLGDEVDVPEELT